MPRILSRLAIFLLCFTPLISRGESSDRITFSAVPTDDPVSTMTMTPDGAYLIMAHQSADQISVWDVKAEKIVKTFSTPAPRAIFCPGDQVFVANFGKGTISVFSIKDDWKLKDELKVDKDSIVYLSGPIGNNFKNQLLALCSNLSLTSYSGHVYLIDTAHDKCKEIDNACLATVSNDGKTVITQGSFHLSPSGGINVYSWVDYTGKKGKPNSSVGDSITYAYPSVKSSYWITCDTVFGGAPISKLKEKLGKVIIPDIQQQVIYALEADMLVAHKLDVQFTELGRRRVDFEKEIAEDFNSVSFYLLRHRDEIYDHPYACVNGNDLHLFIFNMKKGMVLHAKTPSFGAASSSTAAGNDSSPTTDGLGLPDRVAAGSKVNIKLPAGKTYELVNGPDGMSINAGILTWSPEDRDVGVHDLKIRVTTGQSVSFVRPKLEVISKTLIDTNGGKVEKVDDFQKLELGDDRYVLAAGLGYRSLLLLQGDQLTVLKPDGFTVDKKIQLPARYQMIAERDDCYVAIGSDPMGLDVIDKSNLKVKTHVKLDYKELTDFAINPAKRVSYVCAQRENQDPKFKVVIVNESAGTIEEPKGLIGRWVAVDSSGKTMVTGYKDIYVAGHDLEIDPNLNVFQVPRYGGIDIFSVFDLQKNPPKCRQYIGQAGANGNGVRISPDGQRATYLSFAGFPVSSNDISCWRTNDLKEQAIVYPCKTNHADCKNLAFHPTLNLVAIPAQHSVMICDRETGKPLDNKLLLTSKELGEASVENLLFSPDGKSLTIVCTEPGLTRYLRRVPLQLSAQEQSQAAKGIPVKSVAESEKIQKAPTAYKLRDIQSLTPKNTAAMSAKDISRNFDAAVVQITSGEVNGTGFIIGSNGYIMTCAHVIGDSEKIKVSYQPAAGNEKMIVADAKFLVSDDVRDIAILKIESAKPLKYITLAGNTPVESGENVTVIGNPGAGGDILAHTLTTGTVSNPSREIEGLKFIQTSAAVNPGSSGGPMFDSKGQVIGIVSLKADIEAAGFALNSAEIRSFISEHGAQ